MGEILPESHPHELPENIEENDLDPDKGNRMLCEACTLPIFSTPLCNENINFPLHKDCANLPTVLNGHFKHPREPLVLLKKPLPRNNRPPSCGYCKKQCKGFVYHCPDSKCGFLLDVLCAVPIGTIKVLHRSHEHELVPITAKVSVPCHACELNHKGPSYFCNACNFWIHQNCARLPNKIKREDHHSDHHILILTYSSSQAQMMKHTMLKCAICSEEITGLGTYICTRCEYAAHIKCAAPDPQSFSTASEEDSGLIHLPMVDEKKSLVRYLLENTTSNKCTEKEEALIHTEKLFKEKHKHPLIYIKDEEDHKYRLCNGCIGPITLPPFYRCPECIDFFLHSWCANLPLKFQPQSNRVEELLKVHPITGKPKEPYVLWTRSKSEEFFSSLYCSICEGISNGFLYTKDPWKLDVECTFLPIYITHEAHPKSHILFLADRNFVRPSPHERCRSCGTDFLDNWYECSVCRHFKIHIRCAKLPRTVTHGFDKHPLKLTFTRSSSKLLPTTEVDDKSFCEICEDNINTKLWYYGCDECDNWFHIDCIPSVGRLSKIKSGGTIRVQWHNCPLTWIRLLTEYSHGCGICKKPIQGFEDKVAFECSKCDFRVHERCLREEGYIHESLL